VIVRLGKKNVGPDHLSQLESGEELIDIKDDLPNAHLFGVEAIHIDLVDIEKFLHIGKAPDGFSKKKKSIITIKEASFTLINGQLYKLGIDEVFQ